MNDKSINLGIKTDNYRIPSFDSIKIPNTHIFN
jgi:hypothetical protein